MQKRITYVTGRDNPLKIFGMVTFIDSLHNKEYLEIEIPDLVAHIKHID